MVCKREALPQVRALPPTCALQCLLQLAFKNGAPAFQAVLHLQRLKSRQRRNASKLRPCQPDKPAKGPKGISLSPRRPQANPKAKAKGRASVIPRVIEQELTA